MFLISNFILCQKDLQLNEVWHDTIRLGRPNCIVRNIVNICPYHFQDGEKAFRCPVPTQFWNNGDLKLANQRTASVIVTKALGERKQKGNLQNQELQVKIQLLILPIILILSRQHLHSLHDMQMYMSILGSTTQDTFKVLFDN